MDVNDPVAGEVWLTKYRTRVRIGGSGDQFGRYPCMPERKTPAWEILSRYELVRCVSEAEE